MIAVSTSAVSSTSFRECASFYTLVLYLTQPKTAIARVTKLEVAEITESKEFR